MERAVKKSANRFELRSRYKISASDIVQLPSTNKVQRMISNYEIELNKVRRKWLMERAVKISANRFELRIRYKLSANDIASY